MIQHGTQKSKLCLPFNVPVGTTYIRRKEGSDAVTVYLKKPEGWTTIHMREGDTLNVKVVDDYGNTVESDSAVTKNGWVTDMYGDPKEYGFKETEDGIYEYIGPIPLKDEHKAFEADDIPAPSEGERIMGITRKFF